MLPEPTVPKRAAASARPQPWAMTPLFSVPDSGEPDEIPSPGSRIPWDPRVRACSPDEFPSTREFAHFS